MTDAVVSLGRRDRPCADLAAAVEAIEPAVALVRELFGAAQHA